MEMIDIYNCEGNPTGKVKDKSEPLAPDEYRLAVGIWIADESNRLFITKRSMEKSFAPGKWENTSGHVRTGEDTVHAIIRELKEETGISVTEEQIQILGNACSWPYIGKNYGVRISVKLEDVVFQEGETCEAKWVDFPEFVRMVKNGEFSPSMYAHLQGYKDNFLKFIGRPGDTSL